MTANGAGERMETPRGNVRGRPASLQQRIRRRKRRQHQLSARQGPRALHADARVERIHETRRPVRCQHGRNASLGTKKTFQRNSASLVDYEGAADIRSCVHCHPPHATAFAVAHEPIPKCTMPEFEVFLGEVAITPYETPGTQAFADTVIPYIKDTDTILLANHGTITAGVDLMDAYFKTEIIDAYCRILLLAKQLGRVNYYSDDKAAELLKIKPNLGVRDVRLDRGLENCDLCGNSMFREGYTEFKPEPHAFIPAKLQAQAASLSPSQNGASTAIRLKSSFK